MDKLLINRCADIDYTTGGYEDLLLLAENAGSAMKSERIHVESKNPNGRVLRGKLRIYLIFLESSVHNNIMHDCNRHRKNGYRDHTHDSRINQRTVHEFGLKRTIDQERAQLITNKRFPQLAEARDLFLKQAQIVDRDDYGSDGQRESAAQMFAEEDSLGLETQSDKVDPDADFNTLTQAQRQKQYENGDSPRAKAIRAVTGPINQANTAEKHGMPEEYSTAHKEVGRFGYQTLASSIKNKRILKNGYGI